MNPEIACNIVKNFISRAKIGTSTKANVISFSGSNSVEPTLHTALTKDPSVATLLIKKSNDDLSLTIALQSVKDERPHYPSKSYSMVVGDSNPAFFPHFVSLSSLKPVATSQDFLSLDIEQIISHVQESDETELSVPTLEALVTSNNVTQSHRMLPFCQISTAELKDLLDFDNDAKLTAPNMLVKLVNKCLSEEEEESKAFKEIANDLVPFLSGIILKTNHNLVESISSKKIREDTASTNAKWLKRLLFDEDKWYKSIPSPRTPPSHTSNQPSSVKSPFDDDEFDSDSNDFDLGGALGYQVPGHQYKTPHHQSSNPPSVPNPSASIKKAEDLMKSLDSPPVDFSSDQSTFQTFLRHQLHKDSKNKWASFDDITKDRLKLLTKDSNNTIQKFVGTMFLTILGNNKHNSSIQKALTFKLQQLSDSTNVRSQRFEAFCLNTIKNLCEGTVWNQCPIDKLEDITGVSPFSVKPENVEGFHTLSTSSKQELFIPQDSIHFIEQLDSFLTLLCICWSHQCEPSLASFFTPLLPAAGFFDVSTEPVLIQEVKAFITKLSALRPQLDALLRSYKENFASELAVYIHNAFTALVLSIINPQIQASSATMTMGIEDKLERKQFRFNPSSPLFNHSSSSSSKKRPSPTPTQNSSTNSNPSGGGKPSDNVKSNKKQKAAKQQNGFFRLDTNSMSIRNFLQSHKHHQPPAFSNKPICLACAIFGDNACWDSKNDNSKRFHGPMSKVAKPMLKYASDHSIPLSKSE